MMRGPPITLSLSKGLALPGNCSALPTQLTPSLSKGPRPPTFATFPEYRSA